MNQWLEQSFWRQRQDVSYNFSGNHKHSKHIIITVDFPLRSHNDRRASRTSVKGFMGAFCDSLWPRQSINFTACCRWKGADCDSTSAERFITTAEKSKLSSVCLCDANHPINFMIKSPRTDGAAGLHAQLCPPISEYFFHKDLNEQINPLIRSEISPLAASAPGSVASRDWFK